MAPRQIVWVSSAYDELMDYAYQLALVDEKRAEQLYDAALSAVESLRHQDGVGIRGSQYWDSRIASRPGEGVGRGWDSCSTPTGCDGSQKVGRRVRPR